MDFVVWLWDDFRDANGRVAQHDFIEQHKSVNNISKPQPELQAQKLPECRVLGPTVILTLLLQFSLICS